jgi:hypothetical protein
MRAITIGALVMGLASVPSFADEFRADLIAKYESGGGQNIPNWKFDGPWGRYSAGGVCQMLTHTWERVAPTIDIDIVKFPVAGAASEFDQWRACWKLWTLEGYGPWTCCNVKLRQALDRGGLETAAPPRRTPPSQQIKEKSAAPPENDRVALYSARLAASSDVYNIMNKR